MRSALRRALRPLPLLVFLLCLAFSTAARASGVDPTKISLPKGPGSIEGLASQDFVPSLSSGTASYAVPIAVPPGSGGFGPALALSYDSGGGVTEVGLGWRLSGAARIRRRVEDGMPRFDASDTFEILGVGVPCELLEVAPDTFRPEHEDGSFVRVRRATDGSEWEARTKSGITLRFGGDGYTESEGEKIGSYLLREQIDRHGHSVRYEWDTTDGYALLARVVWNEFDASARNEIVLEYETRPDVHHWFASGIGQVIRRRLSRIDVLHGGDLVRRYELGYDTATLPALSNVTLVGRDGTSRMPAARFEYTKARLATDSGAVIAMQNAPGRSPAEADADLADLDGDGLPDLLIATAGSYRSYINHDGKQWLAGQAWSATDSPSVSLSTTGVQVADVDADGAPDLVVKSGIDSFRYFPRPMGTHFDAPVTINTVPSFSFEDPNVRLADMDGDRRSDVIVTTPSGIAIGYNLSGTDWTEPAIVGPVDASQSLMFEDLATQLCDINGDRVQDFCYLRSGGLTYWLGRGRGVFEAGQTADGVPTFDVSAPFRLMDLDGDGWTDLVRVGVSSVSYALAIAEGEFDAVQTIDGTPTKGTATAVEFADMNASGTTDIVWIDVTAAPSDAWRYLELFPDGRAGLLRRIDNGLGKVQTVEYKPAALDAAAARDEGAPWTTRMNIAMPVISRVTVDSSVGDPLMVSEFVYRDGTYDPSLRTFAAFAGGTMRHLGDEYTPTLTSESTFDTGLENRVLRGAVLSEQTRGESGNIFQTTTNEYTARDLEQALDGRSVKYAFRSSERVEHVEDQVSSRVTLTEFEQDDYGNVTGERRWGEVSGDDSLVGNDETIILRTYANNTQDWLLGFLATEETLDAVGTRVAMTRRYYDGDAFQGLSLGQVARGDVTREEAWVGPDPDAFELVNGTRYNDDGQPVETKDGRGGGRFFEWAGDHTSLVSERVKLESDVELIEIAETDPAFGNLLAATEYSGQVTRYEYDVFGRLTAILRPGDTPDLPSVRYEYEVAAPLSRVITENRVNSDGAVVERSEKLVDGLGRERGTLTRDGDRWVLAGVGIFDSRGKTRRSLMPRFVDVAGHDAPPLLDASPRGTDTWYDASGREIRTLSPSGIESRTEFYPFETRHWDGGQNDPNSSYEHTPVVERTDGQGRTVEHVRTLNGQELPAHYLYDAAGSLVSRTDPEGNVAHYAYDGRGRRIRVEDPDLGVYGFAYDQTDNVVERTFPDGTRSTFTFDLAGRSLTEDFDGDGKPEITNVWDRSERDPDSPLYRGKLARVLEPTGSVEHEYDDYGRITATTYTIDGESYTVKSGYDNADREILHVYPDGSSIEIHRNPRGQISGYGEAIAFEYAEDGLETARRFNTGVIIENDYDEDRRRTDLQLLSKSGDTIERLHWTYDAAGNLTKLDDLRGSVSADRDRTESYRYDNLYRLSRAEGTWGDTTWHYSPSGNLLGRDSTVDSQDLGSVSYGERPHAPTAFDGRAIGYDTRGRMTKDGERSYTWNPADQLVKVSGKDGASVENGYGAEGMRRVRAETSADGKKKKTIFIDSWTEVQDGKLARYIVHADQRIVRLADDNGTSASAVPPVRQSHSLKHFGKLAQVFSLVALFIALIAAVVAAHRRAFARAGRWVVLAAAATAIVACGGDDPRDAHGSVRELSDKDTLLCGDLLGSLLTETSGEGRPKATFATYPFGYPRYDDSKETLQYAASPRDTGVLLDHMGARFYAPDLGVWASGDPIAVTSPEDLVTEDFGAANPYAYANQSPVAATDRDGHFLQWIGVAFGGALIGGGIEAARQYYTEGKITDWGRVGAAAVGGAINGLIVAANPAVGLASLMETNAIAGAAGGIADRLVRSGGKDAGTLGDVVMDAGTAALTAGAIKGGSVAIKKVVPKLPPIWKKPPPSVADPEKAWQEGYMAAHGKTACFAAGTSVQTSTGLRPIESIRVGDLVLARDIDTGAADYRPVTRVFITPDKELLELRIKALDGAVETIVATPDHPFWVDGAGWIPAGEVALGASLVTAERGLATLSAVLSREGRATVYNLEVEGFHTYFVGETGAWVHNMCGPAGGGGRAANRLRPDADAQGAHSTFKRDPKTGKVTGHAEWDTDGNPVKRTDVTGAAHGPVKTPHTHEYGPPNVNPATGKSYPGNEVRVRPATPDEIPK